MKVGIPGSGDVAKELAAGFIRHGHDVMLGTGDPAAGRGNLAGKPVMDATNPIAEAPPA
jgi:hypothetical protein